MDFHDKSFPMVCYILTLYFCILHCITTVVIANASANTVTSFTTCAIPSHFLKHSLTPCASSFPSSSSSYSCSSSSSSFPPAHLSEKNNPLLPDLATEIWNSNEGREGYRIGTFSSVFHRHDPSTSSALDYDFFFLSFVTNHYGC